LSSPKEHLLSGFPFVSDVVYVNWEIGFRFSFSSNDWIFALRDAEPITAMELTAFIGTFIPLMAYHYHAIASISGFCFSCYVYTYDTGVAPRSRCLRMNGYLRMHSMRRRKHHCVCLLYFDRALGCDWTLHGSTHRTNASASSSLMIRALQLPSEATATQAVSYDSSS
jgi:hypothetical protein